jgi:hypothetical protein
MSSKHDRGIRLRFEQALRVLSGEGWDGDIFSPKMPFIDWQYFRDGMPYTSKEIKVMKLSHDEWLDLVVQFKLLGYHESSGFADTKGLDTGYRFLLRDKETDENQNEVEI